MNPTPSPIPARAQASTVNPVSEVHRLRIATWNIHKGVRGIGPTRRLEIHDMLHAVEQFDADLVCLQEVRRVHHRGPQQFRHWPAEPQADYLAPEGYEAVYRTNAFTRHGEHGNALLSRWPVEACGHQDISDHRFEQRGLLHVTVRFEAIALHAVVVHLGLAGGSRLRQIMRLGQYLERHVPAGAPLVVAGDFNDWAERLHRPLALLDLHTFDAQRLATFPSRAPLLHLDRIYVRGLRPLSAQVPHGRAWMRMSDHLPLIAEFEVTAP